MLPKGGVGIATVLVGLPAGMFTAGTGDRPSTGVDVIASELGARGCARSFPLASGLGR